MEPAALKHRCGGYRLCDKRAQILQVTDHRAETMEVRLLLSAKDGPTLFDLRCEIRESMLDWIRRNQPEALVRSRVVPVSPVEVSAAPSLADAIAVTKGNGIHAAH